MVAIHPNCIACGHRFTYGTLDEVSDFHPGDDDNSDDHEGLDEGEHYCIWCGFGFAMLDALHTLYERDDADREDPVMMQQTLIDALADIRHACDVQGQDFAALDKKAYERYATEKQHKAGSNVQSRD